MSVAAFAALFLIPVQHSSAAPMSGNTSIDSIISSPFGYTLNGKAVELYTLRNRVGMEARIATYGGIVTYLTAPDRDGHFADVVLGYDSVSSYLRSSPYFGALIGRFGTSKSLGSSRDVQVTR
jgi:aldose 1-epimerase